LHMLSELPVAGSSYIFRELACRLGLSPGLAQ